jgi:CRP/FNR family transcriptional regulator, polysaccharide utilization system transcription regulator
MGNKQQIECACCPTVACFFEEQLSLEQLRVLKEHRKIHQLSKGETLFLEGSDAHGLWVVCNGRVKIFRHGADGKPLITRLAQAGEMVGYRSFFAGQTYRANAEAMEPSTVVYISRQELEGLIQGNGKLALYFLRKLATELEEAEAAATEMAYHGAGARVVAALRRMHKMRTGIGAAENGRFVPVPRQDLAELAGLTVETTVRMLKKLEREGVLILKGKQISLCGETEPRDMA